MLKVTQPCWRGLALGSASLATAEEGRSKMLLGAVPQGVAAADEVSKRLDLWEAGQLEALLQRLEQQKIVMLKGREAN